MYLLAPHRYPPKEALLVYGALFIVPLGFRFAPFVWLKRMFRLVSSLVLNSAVRYHSRAIQPLDEGLRNLRNLRIREVRRRRVLLKFVIYTLCGLVRQSPSPPSRCL